MPVNPPPKTQLDLLYSLESQGVMTQEGRSQRLGVSIGLINALIKRAVVKGYVKVKAAPYKRYAYYLTPQGLSEKGRLVTEYLDLSLDFFRQAQKEYSQLLEDARQSGLSRLALIGGGELAQIAFLAAREVEVEIVGIVDADNPRDRMLGVPVVHTVSDLPAIDALVLSEAHEPQAVFDELATRFGPEAVLAPDFLRISPTRLPVDRP